jgi:antitoxin HigA-1
MKIPETVDRAARTWNSSTIWAITESIAEKLMAMHNPAHPGELLREWLEVSNISVTLLAEHIGVTRATLSRIINGHAGITAEMDLRLHQALGTREGLWLDLQKQRDLWVAKQTRSPRIKLLTPAQRLA